MDVKDFLSQSLAGLHRGEPESEEVDAGQTEQAHSAQCEAAAIPGGGRLSPRRSFVYDGGESERERVTKTIS